MDGTQAQLQFIPEKSTDFLLAVYAEEFGLIGVLLLLVLYLALILSVFVVCSMEANAI